MENEYDKFMTAYTAERSVAVSQHNTAASHIGAHGLDGTKSDYCADQALLDNFLEEIAPAIRHIRGYGPGISAAVALINAVNKTMRPTLCMNYVEPAPVPVSKEADAKPDETKHQAKVELKGASKK
jgi:hypothetical protein